MNKTKRGLSILLFMIFLFGCSSGYKRNNFERLRYVPSPVRVNSSVDNEGFVELTKKSTLSDYLVYAALHNPGLKAAFNRWKAALERIPQVRSLPDPRFNYAYFIREVETRVGPQREKFGLSQTFPWFGKLSLKGSAATEAANAAREIYEAKKLKLFYRVKTAYYEYYYLARAIAVTEENMSLVKYLENVARISYKANITTYTDVIKAQVEIGKLEDRIRALKDLRKPLVAKLNAVLDRPGELMLPWPTSIPLDKVHIDDVTLSSWLVKMNPELKAKAFMVAKEKAGIDLAKKGYFPDITLGMEWIDTKGAHKPNTEDSGKDPIVAMFSVNLPIWYGKYKAAEEEARARHLAAKLDLKDKENNLLADLKMATYRFRDAERKIDLYTRILIPKMKQSLEASLKAFKTGEGSFLDIIDAQRILLEFQLSYERALTNRAEKLAELEMLVGKEIPRASVGSLHP